MAVYAEAANAFSQTLCVSTIKVCRKCDAKYDVASKLISWLDLKKKDILDYYYFFQGRRVLIVIGGDDQYRGEDEEDRTVISRWGRRKVASQFNEECLDGRKSFIFSWNKHHREIHEEALLHYFDPSKKGQKFEYQPKPKPVPQLPEHKIIQAPDVDSDGEV